MISSIRLALSRANQILLKIKYSNSYSKCSARVVNKQQICDFRRVKLDTNGKISTTILLTAKVTQAVWAQRLKAGLFSRNNNRLSKYNRKIDVIYKGRLQVAKHNNKLICIKPRLLSIVAFQRLLVVSRDR